MTNQIQQWVEERVKSGSRLSYLQAWVNTEDSWEHYFSLLTTSSIPEREIRDQQDRYYVVCERRPLNTVDDYLPPEETSLSRPAQITETAIGDVEYQSSRRGDFRVERTYSGDQNRWGTDRSALRVEGWVKESNVPIGPTEDQDELHNEISGLSGIDLDKHPDYRGNILLVLEDQRIKLTADDTPQLEIDSDLLSTESLFVTTEWREYGDSIWSRSVHFDDLQQLSYDERESQNRSSGIPLEVSTSDEEFTVDLADTEEMNLLTPGASEVRISLVKDGITIDWTELPLMRIITTNIQVGSSESERESESGPPALHYNAPTDQPGMSLVIGRHIWDERRIEFGSQQTSRGWCTDADELTVAQALTSIQTEFGPIVKVVDPYLDEDHLIDFVEEIDEDTEVWGITSQPIDTQQLTTKLQSWRTAGRCIEFLRLLDDDGSPSGTPLHDRFILTNGDRLRGWVLGTSFNSLETNVSIITELPQRVVNELDRAFNTWWYEPIDDQRGTDCRKSFEGTSYISS
ncbi:hypothetical protein [Halorhabdus rudnickae]|uniref:hypothetical protein n=1 Tax=Halorhabdus rudnickae TaxID=1775544 RepID=UPI001FCEF0B0|nr:hypothetical protein [Halorhabdus rudnickae]